MLILVLSVGFRELHDHLLTVGVKLNLVVICCRGAYWCIRVAAAERHLLEVAVVDGDTYRAPFTIPLLRLLLLCRLAMLGEELANQALID